MHGLRIPSNRASSSRSLNTHLQFVDAQLSTPYRKIKNQTIKNPSRLESRVLSTDRRARARMIIAKSNISTRMAILAALESRSITRPLHSSNEAVHGISSMAVIASDTTAPPSITLSASTDKASNKHVSRYMEQSKYCLAFPDE